MTTKSLGFTARPVSAKSVGRNRGKAQRIEELGALNDRHVQYSAAGDAKKLRELAAEYAARGMSATAKQIRLEAEGCHAAPC